MEQSEPIDEQELLAYFERTALPIQRIELQLKEIERTTQEAKAKAEIGMAARQAKANAAWSAYERARGAKDRETGLQRSAEAFEKAMNAVRPPVWFAAREALIHVDLARKALQSDKRDEAVEAAMRAVNAWWRMRTRQFEKSLRYGFDGLQARSKGGKKRAELMAKDLEDRNSRILQAYAEIVRAGHPRSDAVKIVAARHGVSTKTIHRVLKKGNGTCSS